MPAWRGQGVSLTSPRLASPLTQDIPVPGSHPRTEFITRNHLRVSALEHHRLGFKRNVLPAAAFMSKSYSSKS